MKNPLETARAGLASLLIVGTAIMTVVVVPPSRSSAPSHCAALTVPTLA